MRQEQIEHAAPRFLVAVEPCGAQTPGATRPSYTQEISAQQGSSDDLPDRSAGKSASLSTLSRRRDRGQSVPRKRAERGESQSVRKLVLTINTR